MHIPLHEVHYLATYWMVAKLSLAHLNKLTPCQFVVLGLVVTQGIKSFKELRQVLVLPMSSFTFLVDKLEKRKLVRRERAADDRRQWLLRATPNGRKLVSEMMKTEPDILQSILGMASPNEKAKLAKILGRLPFIQPGELPDKQILEI